MKKHYRTENDCLNCGTLLEGKFCHNCGQENLQIKESFGHMMNHAISDYFHFDHQFFHTLKPLLFKPGYLTNEYMAGRRAQYLHPVKMYIFISIVYFLLLFQSNHEIVKVTNSGKAVNNEKKLDSAAKAISADTSLDPETKKMVLSQIPTAKKAAKLAPVDVGTTKGSVTSKWFHSTSDDTTYEQYVTSQNKLPTDKRDNFIERQWNKKTYDYKERYGSQAQEMFKEDFKHNIPKLMFLLLPVFALILRITFWKNRKYYVEHLIFAFHYHCFLFLFLAIVMLLQLTVPHSWGIMQWVDGIVTLYILWYTYRALRVVYHRSVFRTITKLIGMSFFYFLSGMVGLMLLFFVIAIL